MWNVMIKGHTLEFRMSGSGSIDPWTGEYCREHNIPLIGTGDVKEFVRIDNHYIYKLNHNCGSSEFFKKYENEELKTYEEVQDWLSAHAKLVKTMDQIDPRHENS